MTITPEQWRNAVAASVAPVVIISASALMCLALYNRLAAIIIRLRSVQRERLALRDHIEALTAKEIDGGASLRHTCILEGLALQTTRIRRRARLIRNALLCLMGAIGLLVVCSLLNGVTIFVPEVATCTAVMFVLGLLMVLGAVGCASRELMLSLAPAEFETEMVSELTGTGSAGGGSPITKRMASRRQVVVEDAQGPAE